MAKDRIVSALESLTEARFQLTRPVVTIAMLKTAQQQVDKAIMELTRESRRQAELKD